MDKYVIESVAASTVGNFEFCTLENHFISQFSEIKTNDLNTNKKAILGTLSHAIISSYLTDGSLTNDKDAISKIFFELVSLKKFDIPLNFLEKREGFEFVLRNIKVINRLKQFVEDYNLEPSSEKSYKTVPPFYGQVDILLSSNEKAILIDYKTGKIFDENFNIKNSIQKQLLAYGYLELERNKECNEISAFVLNKEGIFTKLENYNKSVVVEYSKKIQKLLNDRKKNYLNFDLKTIWCNDCKKKFSVEIKKV